MHAWDLCNVLSFSDMSRKLPSRKRQRTEPYNEVAEGPKSTVNEAADVMPGNMISPDLLLELISNGSVSSHFANLHLATQHTGWLSVRNIITEVEVGSVLATVHATREDATIPLQASAAPRNVPLLLRVFRKKDESAQEQPAQTLVF